MKKIIRFIVFLLVVAAALFFFKPTAKDFETWVKKDAVEKRSNAQGENVVEKLVDKGVTTATQLQLLATYQYEDNVLIALVTAHANGEKKQYLGIATLWIPLP